MSIKAILFNKGEKDMNGTFISEDCKITVDKAFDKPVTWNFDHSKPLGNVISVDMGSGKDHSVTVEVHLNHDGSKLIKRINEMIEKGRAEFRCGGTVTAREGHLIKDFEINEVSLIRKER